MSDGKVKTIVKGTGTFEIEIDTNAALKLLCDTLDLSYFYKEDFDDILVIQREYDMDCIYQKIKNQNAKSRGSVITYHGEKYECIDESYSFVPLLALVDSFSMNMEMPTIINESDLLTKQ